MASNYYDLYIAANISLATSIIIKSDDTVSGLNEYVNYEATVNGTPAVDMSDPLSWKYYLNISGQYHHLDKIITITSLDTQEVINFTIDNLAMHPATATAYAFGTNYHTNLVETYPFERLLIMGILYPVSINTAISAKDGTILGYPPNLVEPNEYSLISNLQKWINGYKIRWTNVQFSISDALYSATALGIMYLNILPALLTIRLEACKTNQAHSFHVRQYLASHNLLNQYIDNMTLSQTLFFYRNIAYIERNSGKQAIFNWLVYNLLTVRNLPLMEYQMKHDLSSMPDSLYPNIIFYKNPINTSFTADSVIKISLNQVLNNEDPLALDNNTYQEEYTNSALELMENSKANVHYTKILESSVIDITNGGPNSINDILFNEWLHLSFSGKYNSYVGIVNPKTGNTVLLTTLDAFTFAWYVYLLSIDINPEFVPNAVAARVQRIMPVTKVGMSTVASIADIMSVVDPSIVDISIAKNAILLQPEITNITSTLAFYNLCNEIYTSTQYQRNLIANQNLSLQRAMVENMVSRIYEDAICELAPPNTSFKSWLSSHNIDISGLNTVELNLLYVDIVNIATGSNLFISNSLKDVQSSMLSIMGQLSSYSVQFIATINGSNEINTNWTAVRVNDFISIQDTYSVMDMNIDTISDGNSQTIEFDYPLDGGNLMTSYTKNQIASITDIGSKPFYSLDITPILDYDLVVNAGYGITVLSTTGDTTSSNNVDIYGFNNNPVINNVATTVQNTIVGEINIPVVNITNTNISDNTSINIGGYPTGLNITK